MTQNVSPTPGLSGFRAFRPILIVFVLVTALINATRSKQVKWNISQDVLVWGNLILFVATSVSFYFYYRSLQNDKAAQLLKFVYAGMFVKLLLCMLSAFIYIASSGKSVNKGGIIVCLGFYVIYTVVEVATLMKMSKQKKNV